jgi:uncharacterized membrane protein
MATASGVHFVFTLVAALGCGLIAGVFFAFSSFVMQALARLPPAEGIAAMQSINVAVINPVFLGAFLGTAAICVLVVISALLRWHRQGAVFLLIGGILYLVGTLLVTVVFHLPRNDALAAVTPASPEGVSLWASYLTTWTAWNHVRAGAALVAAAALTIGLCY